MSTVWYAQIEGHVEGPYSAEGIRELVAAGRICRDTQICRAGGQWIPAGTVEALPWQSQRLTRTQANGKPSSGAKIALVVGAVTLFLLVVVFGTINNITEDVSESIASSTVRPTHEPPLVGGPVEPLRYTIAREDDISIGATVRILARVIVYDEHSRDTILATARAVIEDITSRRNVNEVVVFFYTPAADTSSGWDLASIDWAPDGKWGSGHTVRTGDYLRHQYHVFGYHPSPRQTSVLALASERSSMGVPLPAGATLVESRSASEDQDALDEYEVAASTDDLLAFFLEHMPSSGWISEGRPTRAQLMYKRDAYKILVIVHDGRFAIMGHDD